MLYSVGSRAPTLPTLPSSGTSDATCSSAHRAREVPPGATPGQGRGRSSPAA